MNFMPYPFFSSQSYVRRNCPSVHIKAMTYPENCTHLCCSPKHPAIESWQDHLCSETNHRHSTHLHNDLRDVRPPGKDLPNIDDVMLLQGLIEDHEDLCTVISTTGLIHRTETDLGACWQVNKLYSFPQPDFGVQMQTFTEKFLTKNTALVPCLTLHLQSKMYGHLPK